MLLFSVLDLVKCQRQTRGRRRNGLTRTLEVAADMPSCAPLLEPLREAIELHAQAGRLALDWRRAQKNAAQHLPGAKDADRRVDLAVSGLHDLLQTVAETWQPEFAALAREILDELFPNGPGDYTSLPYSDEHDEVGLLVSALREDRYAEARQHLAIVPYIDRLADLNQAYGQLLVRPEKVSYDSVKASDDRSFEVYTEIFARVLGLFPTHQADDLAARTALLEPLFEQLEDLQEVRARRAADDDEEEKEEEDPGVATSGAAAAPAANDPATEDLPNEPTDHA